MTQGRGPRLGPSTAPPVAGAQGPAINISANAGQSAAQLQQILALLQQIHNLKNIPIGISAPSGAPLGGGAPGPGFAPPAAPGTGAGPGMGQAPTGAGVAPGTAPSLGAGGAPPAPPPAPMPHPQDMLSSRAITAGGGVLAQGAQMAGAGAYNVGAGANLFGSAASGIGSAIGRGLTNLGGVAGVPALGPLGALTGAMGAGLGAWADLIGQGLQLRLANIQRSAALERPDVQSRAMGGPGLALGSATLRQAARLGFEPEEAAGMGAAFRRAIGTTGADVSPYELTLAGIDTGAAARYLGQRAPGYGAQGQDTATALQRLIGTAQAGDLRGSKVDEYLSRLVALNQQAAEKGFKLDLESQAGFLEALRGRGLEGMRGVQVAESLQGVAGGAYARMAAPLRQMAETMMVAQGFAGAPSYEKGLFNVGRMMADPNAAYRGLGTDRAARRLMLAGVAGPDALGLADVSGDLRAQGPMSLGGADLGGVPVSSLMARQSLERMTVARGRGGDTERLLGATQEAQVSLMRSASGDAAEKLVGFGNAILHVAEKMSAGIDALVKLNETRERTYEARETQQMIDGRQSSPYDFSQPNEPRGKF